MTQKSFVMTQEFCHGSKEFSHDSKEFCHDSKTQKVLSWLKFKSFVMIQRVFSQLKRVLS